MKNLHKKFRLAAAFMLLILMTFSVGSLYSSAYAQSGDNDIFMPAVSRYGAVNSRILVPAIQDAYVKSSQPENNYGSRNYLQIRDGDNNYRSYLKFSVSGGSGSVSRAILRLYVTDGNGDGLVLYPVSNNYQNSSSPWLQNGITWNNAPPMSGSPFVFAGSVNDGWIELDVTSAVPGNGTFSFGLTNLSQNSIVFNSNEASRERPVLLIEFSDSPGPTPSPTATIVPTTPTSEPPLPTPTSSPSIPGDMWISSAALADLPTSGPAWNNIMAAAQENTNSPNISDQNDDTDVDVLAKALVYARTGQNQYRTEVVSAITAAMGTESGSGILAVARNLQGYVIAADLIDLQSANSTVDVAFRQWLSTIRFVVFDGAGPSLSVISCHEIRPNNFGTHCGASRIAIALYLGDTADLQNAATVFRGWLGDRNAYAGFNYGNLDWQCDPAAPVGINPPGCTKNGHPIGGVLPDDQRRGGGFTWPPPQENYVWEALQGATVQAELLTRAGYPAWQWQSQALLRAISWLHQEANYPANGDDTWQPWLFNAAYGSNFPALLPSNPGKGMGWTDWTHSQ